MGGLASEIEFDNDDDFTRDLDGTETRFSDRYCANLWFEEAMKWMEQQAKQGKPFLSSTALNTPHSPFHGQAEDVAL